MGMGTYPVKINGIEHVLQYDDMEAERLGLDATQTNDVAALELAIAQRAGQAAADAAAKESDAKAAADAAAADAKAAADAQAEADAKAAADAAAAGAKGKTPANKAGTPASK